MAFALVASGVKNAGGSGATINAVTSTGANLIVVSCCGYVLPNAMTCTDNKGNTYVGLTAQTQSGFQNRLFYCANPIVGTGHTVTVGGAGLTYSVLQVMFFSGAAADPLDIQNGAAPAGARVTLQTGSLTPSVDNALIVAGVCHSGTASSINSGFATALNVNYVAASSQGGAASYLIQTAAGAVNPTWSWTGSSIGAASIASFKPFVAEPTFDPAVLNPLHSPGGIGIGIGL